MFLNLLGLFNIWNENRSITRLCLFELTSQDKLAFYPKPTEKGLNWTIRLYKTVFGDVADEDLVNMNRGVVIGRYINQTREAITNLDQVREELVETRFPLKIYIQTIIVRGLVLCSWLGFKKKKG